MFITFIFIFIFIAHMNDDEEEHFPVDLSKTSLDNNEETTTAFKSSQSTTQIVFSVYLMFLN